jgi:uncharacterized protein
MSQGNGAKKLVACVAEPAPLGLIGLAVAALVLASTDLRLASASAKSLMIPWTMFLGATAQLIAGLMEFRRNNVFGATTFTTYSLLWYAVSITLLITIFTQVSFDLTHYAYGLLGFLVFSLILTVASLMTNLTFVVILVCIDGALSALVANLLVKSPAEVVGVLLILVSVFSFYGAAAVLLNSMAGRVVLPMGGPVWKPKEP